MTTETTQEAAYLTGVQQGWHAVPRDSLQYAARMSNGVRVAAAECGVLVRVSKHGEYKRHEYPVMHDPCPECAWAVAVATDTTEREIDQITPDFAGYDMLAACGLDPLLPVKLCRAILAAAGEGGEPPGPAVIRQLAAVARHRPDLAVSEACAEKTCEHAEDKTPCPGRAVCWSCSLRTGDEAGEWAGQLMSECTVTAPCQPLVILAENYGLKVKP
jgi:hypothetical protein